MNTFNSCFYPIVRKLALNFEKFLYSLGKLIKSGRIPRHPLTPSKIVVCEFGHLGDVIFSTPIYPLLRRHFPRAEIWAIVGSWAVPLLEDNPCITKIITYDHIRMNRERKNLFEKIRGNLRDFNRIRKILADQKFDLGIDLRHYYPNGALLMFLGKVKHVVGFKTRGFSFLLDTEVEFRLNLHEIENKISLLRTIGLNIPSSNGIKQELWISGREVERVRNLIASLGIKTSDKIGIIHPGSGQRSRLWIEEEWARVADFLVRKGVQVVFAGGKREIHIVSGIIRLMKASNSFWNLTGLFSLKEFVALVKLADFLIGLESMSVHVATAVGIPTIAIYSGITEINHWRPWGRKVFVVRRELPCVPCGNPYGCKAMRCLKELRAREVIRVISDKIL